MSHWREYCIFLTYPMLPIRIKSNPSYIHFWILMNENIFQNDCFPIKGPQKQKMKTIMLKMSCKIYTYFRIITSIQSWLRFHCFLHLQQYIYFSTWITIIFTSTHVEFDWASFLCCLYNLHGLIGLEFMISRKEVLAFSYSLVQTVPVLLYISKTCKHEIPIMVNVTT